MKRCSVQTVKLLKEERALLMILAGKRDGTYSDVLRLGLYRLAAIEGLDAQLTQAVQARVDHRCQVEAVWQGIHVEDPAAVIQSTHARGV